MPFHPSFGLSAICYMGTWTDTDEWLGKVNLTNFAHDVKMAKSGQFWQAASPSEDLDWTGSGRVRFFAYAPYHGDIAAGSLSHSAEGHYRHTHGVFRGHYRCEEASRPADDLRRPTAMPQRAALLLLVFKHALTAITP